MNVKNSYREAAARGAGPVRLVICLYEQAIEDVRRAILAVEKGDIEARTNAINHALTVIGQLQGSLDMQRGGEVAGNLFRFYNVVRSGLIDAQFKQSATILEQQASQLAIVREAWLEVERATNLRGSTPPTENPPAPPLTRENSSTGWSA
ncbi:MAG TPA: flagellar protein FliS [Candidatus Binatia bacterium]|nr:flagellar protein FliS [Candidatus Binatia bacterium]